MSKYLRFAYEFEVEVVDPVAAQTFTFDHSTGADGDLGMSPQPTPDLQVMEAVNRVLAESLSSASPQITGFRWMGGSLLPRSVASGEYLEVTLPAMPVRNDDGSY